MGNRTKLRELRERQGITQQDMAKRLEYTVTSYNKIEKGHRQMSVKRAMEAARILNCSLDEIFLPSDFPKRTKGSA